MLTDPTTDSNIHDTTTNDRTTRDSTSAPGLAQRRTAVGHSVGVGAASRWVLAAASAGAGAIHLAMVPSHAAESTLDAALFAVAGWLQLLLAAGALLRPSRRLMAAGVALNGGVIAVWAWSRASGLPWGGHKNHAADVTVVDGVATVLAALAVLIGCAAVVRRRRPTSVVDSPAGFALAGALCCGALVATSIALASPSASDHAAISHGDHVHTGAQQAAGEVEPAADSGAPSAVPGHAHGDAAAQPGASTPVGAETGDAGSGAATPPVPPTPGDGHNHRAGAVPASAAAVDLSQRCDLGFNPASYWQETDMMGVDTSAGSMHAAAAASPSDAAGSAALDSLIALTTQPGGAEAKDAAVVSALGKVDDPTYIAFLKWLPTYSATTHSASGSGDDTGGHGGHLGPQAWVAMTDRTQCDQLASELDRVRAIAMSYPTAADATKGGWAKVTGFVPGIAAHYMNFKNVDGTFDIDHPEMLLYDGDGPDAQVVGVSYYLLHESDFEPTQGFTGPNDHFHRHIGLCVNATGVIGDSATTDEECKARGGTKQGGSGGWMNHVWVVPGCASPWGVFSGASPMLDGAMRENSGPNTAGCTGSGVLRRFDLTAGTTDNVPPAVLGK